ANPDKPTDAFQRRKEVKEAWLNSDNSVLLTWTQDGHAQRESIGSGTLQTLACPDDSHIITMRPSLDGRYIAAGCSHGWILVWDVNESTDEAKYKFMHESQGLITTLAFDPRSELIAVGDTEGDVYVWKLGNSQAWIGNGEIRHKNAVREVNFHPQDTRLLVTAGDDKKAIVWQLDLQKGRVHRRDKDKPSLWSLSHNRPVTSAKFVIRKGKPVVTVVDKTARIWVDETAREKQARGHDDWVIEANTSP